MALTISNVAQMGVQTSLAVGTEQANTAGLGQQSANALAVTNMIQTEARRGNMVSDLINKSTGMGGNKGGLNGASNRLSRSGLTQDLMAIGQAAIAPKLQSSSLDISLDTGGSIIDKLI